MIDHSNRLAVHGGTPVRSSVLPYGHQTITEEDIAAVVEVLRSEWITTGPKVEEFEGALADTVESKHAVCFSSGTAALHAAVFAAGLGAGDEAITTPLTFCATANCLLYQGATPVFADVREDILTLDPDQVTASLNQRTKAILPVDYAGHPADLERLMILAEHHGLVVIEDASHALGATLGQRRVGSISHLTTFSFHAVKHLTTGEGGAVTTSSDTFARRLRAFRNHGIDIGVRERQATGVLHYEMTALGYNYRLTDIACALGLSQLPRLGANIERRRAIAARYAHDLADVPSLRLPLADPDSGPAWHLYPVQVAPSISRDAVLRALQAEGLGVNVHYMPVHLHPYYRTRFGYTEGQFPVAEQAYRHLISLPMFHGMTDDDVADVTAAVRKVLVHFTQEGMA